MACILLPHAGVREAVVTKVPLAQAHNSANIYVNKHLVTSAMEYEKYLGVGVPPMETPSVQNHVISIEVLSHFIEWIFSPLRTCVLKAKGNDGERGCTHMLKDYAARTWTDYREHGKQKGLKGLSKKNYNAMLKLRVFKRAKPEECACQQCVAKGWEGISKLGLKVLREIDALSIWFVDKKKGVRSKPSSPQPHGSDLKKRLLKLWDFLRVRLGSHMTKQSPVATHCLTWLLSSRSDSRLASICTHGCSHSEEESLREYCGAYDQVCCNPKCGKDGTVARGKKLSKAFYACKYCSKISCPKCIRTEWGQSEHLGLKERAQRMFVCRSCSSILARKMHRMSCAECNEVAFFQTDIRRCLHLVQESDADPKAKIRIKIMVNRLCRNINLYIGHVAREKNQNYFWPEKLQQWAREGTYDEMLVLSDFWRIFDGTYERRINCDTGDKQSVETHNIWSVCPPLEQLDAKDVLH